MSATSLRGGVTGMEQDLIRCKFISALEKTSSHWKNDKQFTEIREKMKQGKDLTKEEFDKLYFILQECRQCPTIKIAKDLI